MANTKSSGKKTNKTANKSGSKSASAKKAAETRRRNAEKKKQAELDAMKRQKMISEVQFWSILALAALLFFSNFGLIGKVGSVARSVMLGLFGSMGFFFPVLLITVAGLFVLNKKKNKTVVFRIVGSIILYLDLCIFFHLFANGRSANTISQYYTQGSRGVFCGGGIGGAIGSGLHTAFGLVGAYIIAFLLLITAVVMLTERSISQAIGNRGMAAYENARENAEARRELEGRAGRRRPARGVNLDSTQISAKKPRRSKKQHEEPVEAVDQMPAVESQPEKEIVIRGVNHIDDSDFGMDGTLPVDNKPAQAEPEKVAAKNDFRVGGINKTQMAEDASKSQSDDDIGGVDITDAVKAEEQKHAESEGKIVAPKATNKKIAYKKPPLSLLENRKGTNGNVSEAELRRNANKLKDVLAKFGVNVEVDSVTNGPSVTRYEYKPEMGLKVSRITNLADEIKLNMAAKDVRIEAPIPGKALVGIEIPKENRDLVNLKDLIASSELKNHKSKLAFPAGKDVEGNIVIGDLAKMPHMLVAGTTGSGKSVFTNSILMSVLYRTTPEEVRVIVIDPKVVEFQVYNKIPHLLYNVVTDPKKAASVLNWAVMEMTSRYKTFASLGAKDIESYNKKVDAGMTNEDGEPLEKMPKILIIIDELADLMMVAAKEVEESVCRLAQLARAAGMHMIIATQRPSVDVITGLIKANIPSRVALSVASGTDSRTIIDMNGAEKLLGNGDMLFYPSGYVKPLRLQGAFVSEEEIKATVDYILSKSGEAEYDESIDAKLVTDAEVSAGGGGSDRDPLFADAGRMCIERDKGSTSLIQRQFRVGFNRAARIMDSLYDAGVVGQEETNKPRKILMSMEEFEAMLNGSSAE